MAFGETIKISMKKLSTGNYSPADITVLRANLAKAYLSRGHLWAAQQKYWNFIKDVGRALRSSPTRFLWACAIVFVINNIPERNRSKIKLVLRKFVPVLRS